MEDMAISEKELKLLMNFIKDDLMDAKEEVTIFAVNRNLKAENSLWEQKVYPVKARDLVMDHQIAETVLKKASWNVLRFGKRGRG